MTEYRCYFLVNQYCSGIHAGIQSGHAKDQLWANLVSKAMDKRKREAAKAKLQLDIALKHALDDKTWIILTLGDHNALGEFISFMGQQNDLPFAYFDEPGLNNAHTSVAVVLPDRLYNDVAKFLGDEMRQNPLTHTEAFDSFVKVHKYTAWELQFLGLKATCNLADKI